MANVKKNLDPTAQVKGKADALLKTTAEGATELSETQLDNAAGGYTPQKADGSLDAGVHFKYDIKGNKEG